jgi:sulfate permease, SulP family
VSGASVVVLVVVFGSVVGHIPEAVIGGLLFVIGVELVVGRIPDARLAWDAGGASPLLLVVTLGLTLVVPLQWAIIGGAVLSLLAYVVASSSSARLVRVVRDDVGWLVIDEVPATVPRNDPLIVRYTGPNFFASISTIGDELPAIDADGPGVVVLDLGEMRRYSSTMLKQLEHYLDEVESAGGSLVLLQVEPDERRILDRVGLLERIGPDNVLPPDPHLDVVVESGLQRAQAILASRTADDLPAQRPPSG